MPEIIPFRTPSSIDQYGSKTGKACPEYQDQRIVGLFNQMRILFPAQQKND